MDAHSMLFVQSVVTLFSGALMLAALFVLWTKTPSGWLLFALAGEGVSMLFRLVFVVAPTVLRSMSALGLIWPLAGLVVAAGLMGYVLEQPGRNPP